MVPKIMFPEQRYSDCMAEDNVHKIIFKGRAKTKMMASEVRERFETQQRGFIVIL